MSMEVGISLSRCNHAKPLTASDLEPTPGGRLPFDEQKDGRHCSVEPGRSINPVPEDKGLAPAPLHEITASVYLANRPSSIPPVPGISATEAYRALDNPPDLASLGAQTGSVDQQA